MKFRNWGGNNINTRKQHVINKARELFIEKGFQATSIQDILECSSISKGTFYNYFSSKNELLKAIFQTIYMKIEKDRKELLFGQDPSNIDIFIKQVVLQMEMNRTFKMSHLFEEVFFSNDPELKQFIKKGHLRMVRWVYQRFLDIFGESKKPYLVDCAIMFMGILHQNLKYHAMAYDENANLHRIVRYSIERSIKMVSEVSEAGEILIRHELLDSLLPENTKAEKNFQQELYSAVAALKNVLNNKEQSTYSELLDFIEDELTQTKAPRQFLIESALLSLKSGQALSEINEFQKLEQLISNYFAQK